MLELVNVSKIYQRKHSNDKLLALNNINLSFEDKGFVAILGASGSGKTTLLNVIGGLDMATSGHLIIDGLSSEHFKDKDWDSYRNNKIGFVLQNYYLLPQLNIKDNISIKLQIAKNKDVENKVDEALKEVDLLDKKYELPKALSGGQKQRVAIARALAGSPSVLLCDEPTGALDSKNGKQIMEILKRLSKDHLVIMVTHNGEYAKEYADRIIELKDGEICKDSRPVASNFTNEMTKLDKVSIPAKTTLKWGLKNLWVRKFATLSVVVATTLSLAGIGLILSLSSGVQEAFIQAENNSLSKYPVTITAYSMQSPQGTEERYVEFTSEENVFVDYSNYMKQEHFNYMSEEFLNYMSDLPKENYYVSYYSSTTNFNVFSKVNDLTYRKVSSTSSLFYKGIDNIDFIDEQYDCLKGSYPTKANELALVIDNYNRLDVSYLYSLGFDVDVDHIVSDAKISFTDILNKTYRLVDNDAYYYLDGERYRYNTNYQSLYDGSNFELKITGILREKRDNTNNPLRSGIFYTPALETKVIADARNSEIVKAQLNYGLSKDVLTGLPFEDYQSGSLNISKEYQYENRLYGLGQFERVTAIYFYTGNYDSRQAISQYFSKYVKNEEVDFSRYYLNDYLDTVSKQFNDVVTLMTTVLYVFAIISVFVSAILNAILTYISVHQRTNEIGLLRSIGARKKDIAIMIEAESLISGIIGALLSIGLCLVLVGPLNGVLTRAIYDFNVHLLSKGTFDLGGFRWWVAPILVGISLLTAFISALIPSLIAAKKSPSTAINE